MTDRLDLPPRYRDKIEALLSEHVPGIEVWAYGSRVIGRSHEASDLDLVLRGPTLEPLGDGFFDLLEAIQQSSIPILVQAHDWARLPESFHREIEREYVVLMAGEGNGARDGWKNMTVGELTDNFDSARVPVKQADRQPGPYPYYGASGIVDSVSDYLFDGEYLLIAEDGENLRTRNTPIAFLANGKFWVNNHAHIVRGNHKANTRYLMYALSELDVSGYLTGSTMPKLTQGNMNRISLLTPPLPEQRAIAHVLGTLDDKIELNRRMNETLEEMARALFKSWFVDFLPVRAKMEGRDTGLPQHLADLFPDRLVDSELGEIPEGWEVRSLGEMVETVKGRSYRSQELVESDTALVTLKSFSRGGGYRSDGLKSFAGTYKPDQVVHPGEIAIACTDVTQAADVIGRPAIVQATAEYRTLVGSLDTLIVRPTRKGMTRAFFYFLASNEKFVAHTYAHTTGTTVLHLAKDAVPSFRFACPSTKLVQSFDDVSKQLLGRSQTAQQESESLLPLRDTLLPRLVSGELRVEEAENHLQGDD